MGLPIALGSKCVASRPVTHAQPIEVFDDDDDDDDDDGETNENGNRNRNSNNEKKKNKRDGSILYPSSLILGGDGDVDTTIVTATSFNQELLAIVTIYYYNMLRPLSNNNIEEVEIAYCVAELHIQVSFLGQSTSIVGRDSIHRIRLLPATNGSISHGISHTHESTKRTIKSMALFSSDHRYLICLIAHPSSSNRTPLLSSTTVLFQLRKPTMGSTNIEKPRPPPPPPPLPSYIIPSTTTPPILPVATNPRIVPIRNGSVLCNVASSITTTTTTAITATTMFLIGCCDGSLYMTACRPFTTTRIPCDLPVVGENYNKVCGNISSTMIVSMDHCSIEGTTAGRLVTIFGDGNAIIYNSSRFVHGKMVPEESESESHSKWDTNFSDRSNFGAIATSDIPSDTFIGGIVLHRTHDFRRCSCQFMSTNFLCGKWISSSYLILLEEPTNHSESSIHVFRIHDYIGSNDNINYNPLSTMTMTKSLLLEESADISTMPSEDYITDQQEKRDTNEVSQQQLPFVSVEYDRYSYCIAVTSFLKTGSSKRKEMYSFSCLWSWRVNVLGHTLCHVPKSHNESITMSSLYFGIDYMKRRRLVRVTASSFHWKQNCTRISKESYALAIMSPPYDHTCYTRPQLRESNSLLLSANSISYPITTQTSSNMENYEIDWIESNIPKSYISTYCAPLLATIGKKYGRSIAVASSRGFCVLDRGNVSSLSTTVYMSPKWRLFANETHEREFRVIAFMWWEASVNTNIPSKTDNKIFDDVLVAVIEVMDSREDSGYYLSCWSVRDIELSAQLLSSNATKNGMWTKSQWGIRLPVDFIASSIDHLACPDSMSYEENEISSLDRVATVLVADDSVLTNYFVYQLRFDSSDMKGSKIHIILGHCTAHGNIGYTADLFLASASFSDETRNDGEFTVLGAVREDDSGLDALLISSTNILAVGQVIDSNNSSVNNPGRVEILRYWLADTISESVIGSQPQSVNSFEWTIQLADGGLMCWSLPFLFTFYQMIDDLQPSDLSTRHTDVRCVYQKNRILGIVVYAGTASSWMQQSTRGVQGDFLGNSVPRSSFGYVVGINQNYKKVAASIGSSADVTSFRANFHQHIILRPGEFRLYPPTYLLSLYVQAAELMHVTGSVTETSLYLERYARRKLTSTKQQGTAVLAMQLIVLRLVEKLAQTSQYHNSDMQRYSRLHDGLASIVSIIRTNSTPLQFAIFFLSLGRQMEASSLHNLFPLPETTDDLYYMAADFGSISTSVSALPISAGRESTLIKCKEMFRVCVDGLDGAFINPQWYDFDVMMEEFHPIGEIFRYAMKITENTSRKYNHVLHDDSDSDEDIPARTVSVMCGLSRIFNQKSKTNNIATNKKCEVTPLLVHGITNDKIRKLKDCGVKHLQKLTLWQDRISMNMQIGSNAPQVAARFIVSSIFGGDNMDSQIGWIKVALISHAIVCDTSSEYCYSTINTFSTLIASIKCSQFISLVPLDVRREGMKKALDYIISNIHAGISPEIASQVFDLIVVLIGCDVMTFPADVPGLVLVAVGAAHQAARILDILSPRSDDALSTSYFDLYSEHGPW